MILKGFNVLNRPEVGDRTCIVTNRLEFLSNPDSFSG